jgi:outer membrane protein assembly factor BamB
MQLDQLLRTASDVGVIRMMLGILGLALAALALAAVAVQWRWHKRIRKPDLIALVVLFCLGGGLSGFARFGIPPPPEPAPNPIPPMDQPEDEVNDKALEQLRGARLDSGNGRAAATDEWPQWRGPNRDGISLAVGINKDWNRQKPALVWKIPMGRGFSSLAVAGGRVYTLDFDGQQHERVWCLDAGTGKVIWSYAYTADSRTGGYAGPRATPTVNDGKVYTVGADGLLLCLDADAQSTTVGQVIWQHDLAGEFRAAKPGHGFACSPLVEGDMVIVQPGGPNASIVAFDRHTGKLVWKALSDNSGYSSPVAATAAGVRQIICFTGKAAVGVRAQDGGELWRVPWLTAYDTNAATPVVVGDYAFFSAAYEAGCVLLHLAPDEKGVKAEPVYIRRRKLMRNHHATCVYRDGYLYGCDSGRDDLKCIDFRTGAEKWASSKEGKHSLLYADGHLIVLNEGGNLALVEASPKEFQEKGQLPGILQGPECWAMPALAGGFLYLRDHHQVVCLDLREKSPAHAKQ